MIVFQNKKISPNFNSKKIASWLEDSAKQEEKNVGEIVYLFCDDNFLLKYNDLYLGHQSLTDVISFDYSEGKIVSGDILISVERIKENSIIFGVKPIEELKRVMLHGLLHLIGFGDKTQKEKKIMREKEDYYLKKFSLKNP